MEAKGTNSAGQIGLAWAGPIQGLTPSAQASGAEALVAACGVPELGHRS